MKTGMGAVKESVERAKNQSFDAGYLNFFGWKDGEKKIIRFLTDDVITVDWYDFVVKADGKDAGSFPVGTQVGWEKDYVPIYGGKVKEEGLLVPAKAREKTVGVAVLRKEVTVDQEGRQIQSVADNFEEIEVDSKKYDSRFFGVISQSYRNFWAPLVGYFGRYGTLCDRDYEITRVGKGTDTTYTIIPCDPIDGLRDTEAVQKLYGYGGSRAADDIERFKYCPMTLPEWIKGQASEGRVKALLGDKEAAPSTTTESGFNDFKKTESESAPPPEGGLRAALLDNK